MFFKQFFLESLGCMSYLIGDEETGEAVVVDPQVDVEAYVAEAEEAGLEILHVADTHLHADHVSGNRILAGVTGATLHVPAKARVAYPHEPLAEGTEIRLGRVLVRARESPGHTPEHVTLEVVDLTQPTGKPYAVLTGDSLLVGSAGRPDLVDTTGADDLATLLHDTLRDVYGTLPEGTLVYPGHGPGSACGANMSRLLVTTLGYEKDTNPYLAHESREAFVRHVTADLPPKPGNAVNIKRINTEGPPDEFVDPENLPALSPDEFEEEITRGEDVLVLDTREPDAFAANHVAGAINVTQGPSPFPRRIAPFLERDRHVFLVLAHEDDLEFEETLADLARVGGLDVRGYLEGGMRAWRNAGKPFSTLPTVGVQEARPRIEAGEAQLLDVRTEAEWEEAHVPGATWIPWEELENRIGELSRGEAWIVTCASGYRSTMAASLLKREGFPDVSNLLGGMTAWEEAGYPTTSAPKTGRPERAQAARTS